MERVGVLDVLYTPMYIGYVRRVLEYAVPAWHRGLTQTLTAQLERVQKRAYRIILGGLYTHYQEALETLRIMSLESKTGTDVPDIC